MQRQDFPASIAQKERDRREIAAQIDAFLRRGGRISELQAPPARHRIPEVGSVWHDLQDVLQG
jgi:hypothetical protein